MSECPHELWERESDVTADGSCPICLRAKNERLQTALRALLDEWAHGRDGIQAETVAAARGALEEK